LLQELRAAADPAAGASGGLYLVGHSFGAKLLTAALANCPRPQTAPVRSLVLLQGALSHLAFLGEEGVKQVWKDKRASGVYASIVQQRLVDAPVVVTHSFRDVPNAFWYPLGLRVVPGVLEQQWARPTMYGSLGANGAQRVEAAYVELVPGGRATLRERPIVNVRVDKLVGEHDQILAREIYELVWAAVRWISRP
jgi:pimeloyl-ACP methyl ester carboxylesterase